MRRTRRAGFTFRISSTAAKAGGNHVYYFFNPPKSTEWVKKVSYIGAYKPWGWVIGSGILIDDVETMHGRWSRRS